MDPDSFQPGGELGKIKPRTFGFGVFFLPDFAEEPVYVEPVELHLIARNSGEVSRSALSFAATVHRRERRPS